MSLLYSAIEANSKARSILLNVRPRGIDRRTDTALGECIVDLHKIAAALDAEADRRRSRQGGAA
jgi:hypothetical protein